ncbi:MAG TPA: DNRLRE domain-containing protein [Candidatus Limnocylindria bacterium]|nr:DNRLRE domain-containing protein [Candidatus Limnocylindria bacterium]
MKGHQDPKSKHTLIRIPVSGLTNKSVLQAWLILNQNAASSATPIEARIYPLLESWDEDPVSWDDRDWGQNWTVPGGTRGPAWTSRPLVGASTVGSQVSWQVGPIFQAWQLGTLANNGFVIEPNRGSPDREVEFRSSDVSTSSQRPKLVIHYTDEAPAVRSGWAEIQPRSLRAASTNSVMSLWLDVDAVGSTPSGAASGFDQVTIAHGGTFIVTALNAVVVNGSGTLPIFYSFTDNGTSATFRFPRVRSIAQVRIDFRVTAQAAPNSRGIELPVTVDDSATPGAWAQSLWPGNADSTAGNGDDWILVISANPATRIYVLPDTAYVLEGFTTSFTVLGEDAGGAQFAMSADSFSVVPPSAGTITTAGDFTALNAGTARIIGYAGSLRDTAIAVISAAQTPQITSIILRNRANAPVNALSAADTMFLDVGVSDGDGFDDVTAMLFDLQLAGHAADVGAPAFHAGFRWQRGGGWYLDDPAGTTWQVLPALCSVDEVTTSTAAQTVRLAFVTGRIARASNTGEWSATVRTHSSSPPDTTSADLTGLDALPRVELAVNVTVGVFNSGPPGATLLPLSQPTDGHVHAIVTSNAPWSLEGAGNDLVGGTTPSETLLVGAPNQRISWAIDAPDAGSNYLDTAFAELIASQPAATSETPVEHELYLWVNHPAGVSSQQYGGDLELRVQSAAFGLTSPIDLTPLIASVVSSGGLPAQSVLAEVAPHSVQAGAVAQPFDAWLLPQFQAGNGGIDRLLVDLPQGYGATSVAAVEVSGSPVPFTDASAPGVAEVVLGSRITTSALVRIRLVTDAPSVLDSTGSSFAVLYDDTATPLAPQVAFEGNANGLSDGNSWTVQVLPGPLASLAIAPSEVTAYIGDVIGFTATGSDAFGNPVSPAATWSVQGGIGTIGASSGTFTASAAGSGLVIGRSGAVADTASVTIWPARAIAIRSVRGPASVHQGQNGAPVTIRIENLGGVPVRLDTLRLSFSRGTLGDADNDFTVTYAPGNPDTLPVGVVTRLDATLAVRPDALVGPLAVNARASGLEVGSAMRLTDAASDTTLALTVVLGGYELLASQGSGSVRPGQSQALLMTLRVRNLDPVPHRLTQLVLTNRTSGPGDQETLDDELGDVSLILDDGDGLFETAQDTLALTTSALTGRVRFPNLTVALGANAERRLFVAATLPLSIRDGDRLDLAVDSVADVMFDQTLAPRNAWPVDPAGSFLVDGLVADQVGATASPSPALTPGASDQLAFHLRLPPNGYESDVLRRLAVLNLGTAQPVADITRVRAWVDDGDDAFESGGDRLLGALTFTGDRWELTALSEAVPLAGLTVFFTVDVAPLAGESRTVQLALPSGLDPGVGMASGNSGPLDRELESPIVQTVTNVDRVTLTAMPLPDGAARPDQGGLPLLHLVASNTYAADRTLTALTLANRTTGPGTPAERDREPRVLTLQADGDDDGTLDPPDVDPVLATGFFAAGSVDFTGLAWSVPAAQSSHLFVTADVSLDAAADGDVLGCSIDDAASIGFAEPTTVTALWPLDSGARWTIDGLIAAQLGGGAVPAQTVGPGDARILALDLVVPPNGYQPDVLRGLFVTNLGTATASDLSTIELWQDGGDGAFSSGAGDDVLLGPLTPQAQGWQSPLLAAAVAPPGARLFVSISVGGAPAESSTVRLAVPVNGVQNESGNDGPLDASVESANTLLISGSPLLATLEVPAASALGQTIEVRMIVRNTSAERVVAIAPTPLDILGTAALTLIDGPTPATLDLDPAARDTVIWHYSAVAVGEARLRGAAEGTGFTSGLVRRAPAITSGLHRVFSVANRLDLSLVHTMPVSVNPGALDVVPFSLTLTNPGGEGVSDVNLRRLRVRLETESGQPIVPTDLLARVTVNEGTNIYLVKTALETSGNEVDLALATPARVTGLEPTTLNLRLDLLPAISVPTFRLLIQDSAQFFAEDATSLAPVGVVLDAGSFPIRSNVARILAEATDLDVAALGPDTLFAARGGVVPLSRMRFENRGTASITSDVRLASFVVGMQDTTGLKLLPGNRLSWLRVLEGTRLLASFAVVPADGPELTVALSPPLNLPVNTPLDLTVEGTIAASAPLGTFRLLFVDSARVDAYDANSRAQVAVNMVADTLAGAFVTVEANADSLLASHSPVMPPAIVIGEIDVRAIAVTLRHPGTPGTARIRVDSVRVALRDEQRQPLAFATYLDRLAVRWNGVEVASAGGFAAGSVVTVPLSVPLLQPGDTARIELALDVDGTAPAGSVELVVAGTGLYALDVNRSQPVALGPEPGSELPMLSGLGRLVSPSRELVVGLENRMPTVLAADGRATAAAELSLSNRDPQGAGSIFVDWLRVNAAGQDFSALPLGTFAERVDAYVDGVLWGQSAPLTADSVSAAVVGLQRLEIPKDQTVRVELRWTPRTGAVSGRVRLGLDRPDVGVVQPGSALLAIAVLPENGQAFPLWSQAGGFSATDLSGSYANFPNPFAAGRQGTTFTYYLRDGARVSLRILTPRGVSVATLLDGVARAPGLHQDDRWDGRNGSGSVVANGVYVAELSVRYDDGTDERELRKVAVVR